MKRIITSFAFVLCAISVFAQAEKIRLYDGPAPGSEVPADPMPLFLAAGTSEASSANGFGDMPALYNAWSKTRQPLEIHSFTRGFHGFGYRDNGQSVNIWTTLLYNFLDNCNLLNKNK